MTWPIAVVVLGVLAVILIVDATRRILIKSFHLAFLGIVWLVQRIFAGVPALAPVGLAIMAFFTAIGRFITIVLPVLGWILAVAVLATAVGIWYGNTLVLITIATILGTVAYLLHRAAWIFGSTWGAGTALVLYGLAVAGLLFPFTVRIPPGFVVAGLLLWAMFGILRRLAGQQQASAAGAPALTRTAVWAKWGLRTAMIIVIIAAGTALTITRIGWLNVGWNRTKYENTHTKNQSERQEGLQLLGLSEIEKTDAEIYFWRQQEVRYGGLSAAHQQRLDVLLARRERQRAAVNKGEPELPRSGFRMPRMRPERILLYSAIVLVGLLIAFGGKKGGS